MYPGLKTEACAENAPLALAEDQASGAEGYGGATLGAVVVKVAENDVEGEIVRQVLEDSGVKAMVRSVDPLASRRLHACTVDCRGLVREEHLERARDLLGLDGQPRGGTACGGDECHRVVESRGVPEVAGETVGVSAG